MMSRMASTNASRPAAELGPFLRARRERTSPRDVGLPDSGRRRTPGLRREEVATLAGVSVDYLVRLEQGRDVHPSAEVLAALADAMRLTEDERMHLMKLGVKSGNEAFCPAQLAMLLDVPATVVALLDALDPTPAFVLSPAADVLAWNASWATVVHGIGLLEGGLPSDPTSPGSCSATPPPGGRSPSGGRSPTNRRGDCAGPARSGPIDEHFAAVVDGLAVEPEFAVRWDAHPVAERRRGQLRLDLPEVGELALAYEVLELPDAEQQLVSWLPADEDAAARLERITGPPRLRLVQG